MSKIVDGCFIAKKIRLDVFDKVKEMHKMGLKLCLAVVVVGFDAASEIYVKNKTKACNELQISLRKIQLKEETTQIELNEVLQNLNSDENVNGIIVQLPLPPHLSAETVARIIDPVKDVDGFCCENVGGLFLGLKSLKPCTPLGIMKMFEFEKINLRSKHCVVVGKSNIVGKPMALMLLEKGATVTICSSKALKLNEIVKMADILIVAVGKANLITENMVKNGVIVVDVGINRLESGKICGDVAFDEVKDKASLITPVPGGVGPLTVASLMENVVLAAKIQHGL